MSNIINDDPAGGTAKTTNTEEIIIEQQKKAKKKNLRREQDIIVKIKKMKKGVGELPVLKELGQGKKSVQIVEVNSRYMQP